jgi:hypothetical protein
MGQIKIFCFNTLLNYCVTVIDINICNVYLYKCGIMYVDPGVKALGLFFLDYYLPIDISSKRCYIIVINN